MEEDEAGRQVTRCPAGSGTLDLNGPFCLDQWEATGGDGVKVQPGETSQFWEERCPRLSPIQ